MEQTDEVHQPDAVLELTCEAWSHHSEKRP
jgi:hypothetical protein